MTETADSPVPVPLWRRLAAAAYDGLLIAALWFPGAALFLLLSGGKVPGADAPALLLAYRLYLLAIAFAFLGGFWVHRGQTLGMLAWRVRLARSGGGGKPDWRQALIRFLAALVSWAALGAGFWWALFDRDNKTWHDRLSGTELLMAPSVTERSRQA
jgi:uncharacterized RDD family membrane protein YckC